MSSTEALREHLKKWKAEAEADATRSDVARLRAEWLDDLRALMDTLHGWLRDAESDGLLRIHREGTTITEPKFGTYDAPAMIIQAPGPRSVHVHPVGLEMIGSIGRVDLDSGPRKVRILRQNDRSWALARSSPASRALYDFFPLDEQSFASALDALLELDAPAAE